MERKLPLIASESQKKMMLKALAKKRGIIKDAAAICGISRKTHYDWIRTCPWYAACVDEIQDAAVDFVESKLFNLIDRGSEAATIFFMKTRGKGRGYIEKIESDITINKPVVNIDWTQSAEEIQEVDGGSEVRTDTEADRGAQATDEQH